MSGSTGTPMNLNTFDGTDDVVKALTDLFNQNMNLINSGDIHTKVWKPNTAYQKNDILVHPYHNSLIYALSSHTSSNSTTESDWSTNDGSKWRNLSYAPVIANWMANMNYNVYDTFMDGLELKQATTAGSSATLDRTKSAFIGSRVANWTPNTKYNIGDLAYIGNLNASDNTLGTFKSTIVRCIAAHTSSIQFPASTDNKWEIVNLESYTYFKNINQGNGLMGDYIRIGQNVNVHNSSPTSSSIGLGTGWSKMANAGTIPDAFLPAYGTDSHLTFSGLQHVFTREFRTDGSIWIRQTWGSSGSVGSGTYFVESPAWITKAAPVWATAVPTF